MTSLKCKNLRSETIEELVEREVTLCKELYELRVKAVSGRIEKPHMIEGIKRDIARILTVLREKKK